MNNLALIGGNIITMDEHRPFCEAVPRISGVWPQSGILPVST